MAFVTHTNDIGSIFSLSEEQIEQGMDRVVPLCDGNRALYSLCREALYEIALLHSSSNKTVLLPAYTCMTVAQPFLELGWRCVYYSIDKQLRIVGDSIMSLFTQHRPAVIVAHPFFGMDFSSAEWSLLEDMKTKGCTMVIDLTQCVFSTQRRSFVDYYVGSLRKWLEIPDGGFLETTQDRLFSFNHEREYNLPFASRQTDAMYLRGLYFSTGKQMVKEISRRLNQEAVNTTDEKVSPHRMDSLSYSVWKGADLREIEKKRHSNFRILFEALKGNEHYRPVCQDISDVTTAPLYFTIYVSKRTELQRTLAASQIYAPLIWPLENEKMCVSDDVAYIYQHILAIPCDQRYGKEDMLRIIDIIEKFK
ncbi:MAG: hypothetical protein J6W75_00565 [Bacteroidaceae bacterium]|nr:hypothetical protein [Bacteroidaceae bacterium]